MTKLAGSVHSVPANPAWSQLPGYGRVFRRQVPFRRGAGHGRPRSRAFSPVVWSSGGVARFHYQAPRLASRHAGHLAPA